MRSPLSLMAASSGLNEQNVPVEGANSIMLSPEDGNVEHLNGSSEDDVALINFIGMKMGEGLDKNSEDDPAAKAAVEAGSTNSNGLQNDNVSGADKDEVTKKAPRAKMSISPARLPGKSLLGSHNFHDSTNCFNKVEKVQSTLNFADNGYEGSDAGVSTSSSCDAESKISETTNDSLSNNAQEKDSDDEVNGDSDELENDREVTLKLSNSVASDSSMDSSSLTKAVPKARKSFQSSTKSLVKTVNLAPITNKTVKVVDLESALKCDRSVDSLDSLPLDETEEESADNHSETKHEEKTAGKVKKKRKFRTGNYSFPGQKKKKKNTKRADESLDNSCNKSVGSNASLDEIDGMDDKSGNEDSINTSVENTNVQSDEKIGSSTTSSTTVTNSMTVLSQNAHLAFRAVKAKMSARKRIKTSTSPKGKSVMDMLNSLRKAQALKQQAENVRTSQEAEGKAEDSVKLADETETGSKENTEDDTFENIKIVGKRKTKEDENGDIEEASRETSPSATTSVIGKRRKTDDGSDVPITPVVTIVSEHQPVPGLKSILPKNFIAPSTSSQSDSAAGSSVKDMTSPLAVLSSQLAASKNNPMPKHFGPKNSEALRALLVSGSPALPSRSAGNNLTSTPIGLGTAKHDLSDCFNGEKVVAPHGRETKIASTPNGLCYPVTPPKTPEDGTACDNSSQPPCPVSGSSPDRDIIPLCCCKINGASFNKLTSGVMYCQALDSVDGKVMGCCNKVSNNQLVRSAVKIPFMAVCEAHRKRLKLHQCCPGCGHFCTQGKFYQCRKEGGTLMHTFHKQCQVFKDGKYYCPHCGEESAQLEKTLGYTEPPAQQTNTDSKSSSRRAVTKHKPTFVFPQQKMKEAETAETPIPVTHTLPSSKVLSSEGLPLGPTRHALEKMLSCVTQERPKKYRNLSKSMYLPAYEGDLEKVVYMLIDGVDPNVHYEDYDDETALHGAAASGHLAIVHVLVQAGAQLHLKDKTLKTPLMMAAEHNNPNVVQYFMKMGTRLDDKGEDGMTCIHYAAKCGHNDIIKLLLDNEKIAPNVQDDGGWTPIIWAAESQFVSTVRYLMSQGADPIIKDNEENTGLHWAAFAGSVPIMEMFLDGGCELDSPNEHGDRPLHIAARQNHYECVVLLLARGADVEVRNNNSETPLSCCLDQTSSTWMALKVNKQLRGFAAKLSRPEKLLHRDVSYGREKNPIACVNAVDDEAFPTDYLYVAENIETSPLNINRVITSLQSCRCKDDCSSQFCVCARSSVKCWFDKFGHLSTDFNLVEPPLLFECNKACRCWTNCNNRVVQNGITCRLRLVRTDGRGWGVKTLTDIPRGTFICEYIGELISDSEADRREDDSYLFDLDNKDGETYCIDARKYGNISRFINHLCEPNVVPVKVFVDHQDLRFPRICFFSSRDIKAHEELGFDYGEKFWIIKWKQFTCACQSPKCKYSSETIHKTLQEYRLRHEVEEEPSGGTEPQ